MSDTGCFYWLTFMSSVESILVSKGVDHSRTDNLLLDLSTVIRSVEYEHPIKQE